MMKTTLILTLMVAAMAESQAFAADQLKASDYKGGVIYLGTEADYNPLIMDKPLTLQGTDQKYIDVYDGAKFEFQTEDNQINTITIRDLEGATWPGVVFHMNNTYDISFDTAAQSLISTAPNVTVPLITIETEGKGFLFYDTNPTTTTLKLQGVAQGGQVSMNGVQYTYVGAQEDGYNFQAGEIGFTGYKAGSCVLNLVAKAPDPVPEPATGTLSLLALGALAARRRRK